MDLTIFSGLGIGLATFLIIGLFHPAVIWVEYYLSARYWWIFLILGVIGIATSLMVSSLFWSAILGVFGFSSFWSIKEVIDQRKRVEKGWFPDNPNRKVRNY
ncbi:MAG: DUF4491 family protein [Rikenellaceae bacterium]